MPRALITGVTGQDGYYLSQLLIAKGYEVFGLTRGQASSKPQGASSEFLVKQVVGDLLDGVSLGRALHTASPDEIYNLGAASSAQHSFDHPLLTAEVTGLGPLRLLEALRAAGAESTRFYQASSSEMFGTARETPQNESTPFHPRSPYGSAKAFAHHTTVNYRERYGRYAVSGILFNHESPRRGMEFVTRKISHHAAAIKLGSLDRLELGNLDAERDWGFAGDYVRAMHLMLQRQEPQDFVIGTGETHTVREFVTAAFAHVGLDWRKYVVTNAIHARPAEEFGLRADARRVRHDLGWSPTVTFAELVALMVESDLRRLGSGDTSAGATR